MTASIAETSIAAFVPERAAPSDPAGRLAAIRDLLLGDALVPYLGPGLLALAGSALPSTPEAVAAALHAKAPAPARIRTNMWSAAQFIESRRHRKTLQAFMADIFAAPVAPSPLVRFLAGAPLRLVVNSWYDDEFATALRQAGREDFVEIQGITARRNQLRHLDRRLRRRRQTLRRGRGRGGAHGALFSPWRRSSGAQFPGGGFGLCRGHDRDRHPDADPLGREGGADRSRLFVPGLSVSRPDASHLRATDHEALEGPAFRGRRDERG